MNCRGRLAGRRLRPLTDGDATRPNPERQGGESGDLVLKTLARFTVNLGPAKGSLNVGKVGLFDPNEALYQAEPQPESERGKYARGVRRVNRNMQRVLHVFVLILYFLRSKAAISPLLLRT